ncbi:hypothetical protein D9M68_703270 [compost metagenome]
MKYGQYQSARTGHLCNKTCNNLADRDTNIRQHDAFTGTQYIRTAQRFTELRCLGNEDSDYKPKRQTDAETIQVPQQALF